MYHIKQNLFAAEFMGGKASVNSLLTKLGKILTSNHLKLLEELYSEVRSQNVSSAKSIFHYLLCLSVKDESTKASGELEEDITSSSVSALHTYFMFKMIQGSDLDDNGILKYNYAVALQLAGKKNQSLPLLEELFQNKESIDDYILLKATLGYLVYFCDNINKDCDIRTLLLIKKIML